MEKENKSNLSYDEAIARVETIVRQLEQSEALSMDEYRTLATEAKDLLSFCRRRLEKDQSLFSAE